jgi:hypothetical protein
MSPIGLTVSCKSPPPIQACIYPSSSIREWIDSGPPFEHVLTQVWTSAFCILFYNWFYVIASSNDVISSKVLLIWKAIVKGFHLRYYTICFLQFQNLTSGTLFLTLKLTMKVIRDRPTKLISWVADYVLLSHQVWSWSNKKYSKNKVFISIMTWPKFDLDHDPYHLVWLLLTPSYSYILTMIFRR